MVSKVKMKPMPHLPSPVIEEDNKLSPPDLIQHDQNISPDLGELASKS